MGRVREKRRVEERRWEKRKSQKKEDADVQKGRKVAKHCVSWFVAPEGRKVGPLKRRVRSQLARWAMKKCMPLWREAHLQVKKLKTPHVRTTFGSWDAEKVHAVAARSTFRSQNVQSTPASDNFWKLRCRKSECRCGAKHISKSKCTKHTRFRPLFWKLRCRKSARCCGTKHISKSKCTKQTRFGPLLDVKMPFRVAGARDCAPSQKWAKREKDGRRGTFEEDLQRWISRGRRSTKDMFIRDVRRSGRWFPERGCILEHQVCWNDSYDLASLFRGRRSTLDRWTGKIAKHNGTRTSALHSTFHFWRRSRRILLFLMLSTSKNEEVSQNSFVFKLAHRQKDRQTDRDREREGCIDR